MRVMTINITTITMTIAITRTTLAAYQITSMLFNWTLSQNLKNNYSWNTEAQRTTMLKHGYTVIHLVHMVDHYQNHRKNHGCPLCLSVPAVVIL
jgi:hypothetical protein